MQRMCVEAIAATQFGLKQPPTLLVQRQFPKPVTFSQLRASGTIGGVTKTAPPGAAFVLLVVLAPMPAAEIWIDQKWGALPAASPGDTLIFDLATKPFVNLTAPCDFLRLFLPATARDRLTGDRGFPRVPNLRATPLRMQDPVIQGLALSILPVLERPLAGTTLFLESVALAFHAHIRRNYGVVAASGRCVGSGLAHWQLRRVSAFADAHLDAGLSTADLAAECRLSPSHFNRAFSTSTGTSPHKWLVNRRVERAKALLRGGGHELSQIALACGFADQSHFARVFVRSEGQSPGRWRRLHCSQILSDAATLPPGGGRPLRGHHMICTKPHAAWV
jgi:AraC family transcriptional regulator